MSGIELSGVAKRYGDTTVLEGLDLVVPDRSVTALLGASGSGKSTTLRLIAGFERPDAGRIAIGGRVVDDGRRSVRAQDRQVGYVPQDGALFPHLTVRANIGFGVRRPDRDRIGDLVDLVGLSGLEGRYPHQLSGGQQQRVALARALAVEPDVVLLDEPFSSLDASLRDSLRRDVVRILDEARTTAILVTHDQEEALAIADQVALLADGRLLAAGPPRSLYRRPSDLMAAAAIGEGNVLPAVLRGERARCALGDVAIDARSATAPVAGTVLLRPEQLVVSVEPSAGAVEATVVDSSYRGHHAVLRLRVLPVGEDATSGSAPAGDGGTEVLARVAGDVATSPGASVWVSVQGTAPAWADDAPEVGSIVGPPEPVPDAASKRR